MSLRGRKNLPVGSSISSWAGAPAILDDRERALLDHHWYLRRARQRRKRRREQQPRLNAGGGFDYMAHRGALVDVILGVEYQHFDVSAARAFCVNPGCVVPAVRDFDLSASGDIVRARLTVKTHGFGFGPPGGVGG
jgi:hypothetical protein